MLIHMLQGLAMILALWSVPAIFVATCSGEEKERRFLIQFATVASVVVVICAIIDVARQCIT